jgi:putative phosphoribosyl transferase
MTPHATPFSDRTAAGHALARRLLQMQLAPPVVVFALPRGGVPVAAVIARALDAPLDLLIVRKIGLPWQPELAVAALVDGEPPDLVVDHEVQRHFGVERADIDAQARREFAEIARRRGLYLGGRAPLPVSGATAIVVDDGIATGTTMRAALRALRRRGPARLVLAVPVAPADTLDKLRHEVDDVVCLASPEPFRAVGLHYVDFHQVGDAEVLTALAAPDTAGAEPA